MPSRFHCWLHTHDAARRQTQQSLFRMPLLRRNCCKKRGSCRSRRLSRAFLQRIRKARRYSSSQKPATRHAAHAAMGLISRAAPTQEGCTASLGSDNAATASCASKPSAAAIKSLCPANQLEVCVAETCNVPSKLSELALNVKVADKV